MLPYVSPSIVFLSINFRMQPLLDRLARHLKPGGHFLLRDYGRHDMTQLRFKKGGISFCLAYLRWSGLAEWLSVSRSLMIGILGIGRVVVTGTMDSRTDDDWIKSHPFP